MQGDGSRPFLRILIDGERERGAAAQEKAKYTQPGRLRYTGMTKAHS